MKLTKLLIGLVCCLASLSGCSTSKLDGEGQEFVTGIIDQQKQHWDASKVASNLDPASGVTQADVEKVFKMYTDVVGPIKSVGAIERTNFQSSVGVGVPDYKGSFRVKLTCAKGPANCDITVLHKDGKWTILGFNVNSDAFKNIDKAERAGAQEFVDRVTKQICNSWKVEVLMDNASPEFADDLKKQSVLMKGLFLGNAKTLGDCKDYKPARFFNIEPVKGQTLYNYAAEEEFEKGRVAFQYAIVKVDGAWKLRGFHAQSKIGN